MLFDPLPTNRVPYTDPETCPCCDCNDRCPSVSLSDWAKIMCVSIPHFFQFSQDTRLWPNTPIPIEATQPCHPLVYEYGSQGGDISGRKQIYDAILRADEEFYNYTRFWPVPTQMCDEFSFKQGHSGGTLRLSSGKLKGIGRLTFTHFVNVPLLDAMFQDLDGDGVIDHAVFTVDTPTFNPKELRAFIGQENWNCDAADCYNKIDGICLKPVVGDTAIITVELPVYRLVKPSILDGYSQKPIDPNDLENYVDSLDLYREWINPATAITIMRRTDAGCACGAETDACYACENVEACVVNAERGLIRLKMRGSDNPCYCTKCAHRVCISYVAGDCGHPAIIAHLAATYLCKSLCCSASEELKHWQADYVGVDNRLRITTSLSTLELQNPFGTLRGQIDAYRYLRWRRQHKAVRL